MAEDATHTQVSILLVDDEALILRTIPRLFHKLPVSIRSAHSAAEALTLLEQEQPDLLISDFEMPGTNGLDLLEQVRLRWPKVHSILNTGESGAIADAKRRGFVAVFKADANDSLLALVTEAVERKRSRQ